MKEILTHREGISITYHKARENISITSLMSGESIIITSFRMRLNLCTEKGNFWKKLLLFPKGLSMRTIIVFQFLYQVLY